MKIIPNPNRTNEQISLFRQKLHEANGYCPCRIDKNQDTKCLCKEFRESQELGECHCGLYVRIED